MSGEPLPKLMIEVMPDGSVQVQGPIQNRMLCYGLLEAAKDAIRRHGDQPQPLVQVPRLAGLKSN